MDQVMVDAELRAKLHGLNGPLDFCDERGQLLGHFVPSSAGIRPSDLEPGIPTDELRRRAQNFQGKPLGDLVTAWEKRT
jgi:hypothetical protein